MAELMKTVLIVDDEENIHEFLTYNLEKSDFIVYSAKNGLEGIRFAKKHIPDVILLDVTMPEMDGIMTCIELRKVEKLDSSLIIFLTARGEDYSQIAAYNAGADDYIKKPISPKVLIMKLRIMLTRKRAEKIFVDVNNYDLTPGKLFINKEKYLIVVNNKEIILPRKEFELLAMLASKPDKVFTRDEIFSRIWGDNSASTYRTIDVHIRKIREKLGGDYIKTQKGVGYRFSE
ncbi:MAG: response regulator transcription factor [Bacteroidia bacterium]|nr:response regulator transcription factor [Bacteroidia bacterium]